MHTPWGESQFSEKIADGIVSCSTASHGGLRLSAERQAAMPAALRVDDVWYEEDCEWARVALAFPEAFDKTTVAAAHDTARNWFPDAYAAYTGKPVTAEESLVVREREAYARHAKNYIVTSAWGDWHAKVPKGMVGVVARIGGRNGSSGVEKYFLVSKEEYNARREACGFVVDPARHAVWEGPGRD